MADRGVDEQLVYQLITRAVTWILAVAAIVAVLLFLPHYLAHIDNVRAEAALQRGSDR